MSPSASNAGRRGFTLVELLVVLSVAALLLGVLAPVVGRVGERGRGTVCLGNLRSIGQAVALYCEGSKGQYPLSSHTTRTVLSEAAWLQSLEPFGVRPEARLCPSDPFRALRATSYATNEHFEPLSPGLDFNPITRQPIRGGRTQAFRTLSSLRRPAAVIYAFEPEGSGSADHLHTHQIRTLAELELAVAVRRHFGAANYLFADGHASAWPWDDLAASFRPDHCPFDPVTARAAP
jgi:prepilin-type N-terminal cleavage/methylation domain-containing protein/prepilin-type processing-associated H-X9-DG protein